MKIVYSAPKAELERFDVEDIITTSVVTTTVAVTETTTSSYANDTQML